jgi:ATP-dependent RNA helicase DDX5/DBP2
MSYYGAGSGSYGPSNGMKSGSYGSYGNSNSNNNNQPIGSGLHRINWDLSKLPVFEKNFYVEHPVVKARSEAIAEEWRKSKGITIIGRGIPKPVLTFEEASMPEYVLNEVLRQGFDERKLIYLNNFNNIELKK